MNEINSMLPQYIASFAIYITITGGLLKFALDAALVDHVVGQLRGPPLAHGSLGGVGQAAVGVAADGRSAARNRDSESESAARSGGRGGLTAAELAPSKCGT